MSLAGRTVLLCLDLLGHSYISVTSRYLGASPQRAEAVAALDHLPGLEGAPPITREGLYN